MVDRFEKLTIGIAQIYKCIQRIKKCQMKELGLKGTHVMCLYYLSRHPEGLAAADLCGICKEDKAGISRILSDLEINGYICYEFVNDKKYRAKATLTPKGKKCARSVNKMIRKATEEGGVGITEEEREIFYRVLFLISDNLNRLCCKLDKR
ncbi:MAG: winged helix-turn-helix transcriptional regulator [Lachnospiraceae bacterium]|nr:winged helix-turn-helix transcriptional regulator [Lachnospiraceae bacterium]